MNTLLCFLLGKVPFTTLVFNAFSLAECTFIPLFLFPPGVHLAALSGPHIGFLFGEQQIQTAIRMRAFQLLYFISKPISSVTTADISKSLFPLTHHRVNISGRDGTQVLESFRCILPCKRFWGHCRNRALPRLNTVHVNKQGWFPKSVQRSLHGQGKLKTAFYSNCRLIHANTLHGPSELWGCSQFFLISSSSRVNWILTEINCN